MTTTSQVLAPVRRTAANGLEIIVSSCNGGLATIAVALPCGTTDETGTVPLGASLLLGRLLTQGSRLFPNAEALAMNLETLGGVYNAGTDQDLTAIVASVPVDELAAALTALVDLTTNPRLDQRVLGVERRRLSGQFRAATAVPASRASDLADKLMWPDSPEGRTSQEMARAVPRLEREALAALHQDRFRAGGAALAIATPGDPAAALDMAEAAVATAGWVSGTPVRAAAPALGSGRVAAAPLKADLAYLSLIAPAVPRGHPDADGLSLTAVVLGGGATSRLFVEVREKRGLCYGIGCRYTAQANAGTIRVEAGVPADRLDDAMHAILEQFQDLAVAGTEAEVAKARALLLGHLAMESDRPETWARRYSRDLVQLGRIRTYADVVLGLSAVTPADVRRLAATYLAPERLRFSVAGPGVTRAQVARFAR